MTPGAITSQNVTGGLAVTSNPTQEQIEKLPQWAQKHLADVKRQRDVAIRALDRYVAEQTPSPFYTEDLECTGETSGPTQRTRYIQARGISVDHAGVHLDILLRDGQIDLNWGAGRWKNGEVAAIPSSWQALRLVAKDNMR